MPRRKIIEAIPGIIHLAETVVGPGNGAAKKEFAMDLLGVAYDKFVPEKEKDAIPMQKEIALSLLSIFVDKTVPKIFKK